MSNIILEGLDFTGKTPITKKLSDTLSLDLVNKDRLFNIIDDPYNINNIDSTFDILNNLDGVVFDRHFMSLLVYWKLTNKSFYESKINEEQIFNDFINSNEGSIFLFRYTSYERVKNSIFNRIDFKENRLTKHDLNLLDKNYFNDFSFTFHNLYEKFDEYNKNNGFKITTVKQSSAVYFYKKSIKEILNIRGINISNEELEKSFTIQDELLSNNKYEKEDFENFMDKSKLHIVFNKCIEYVIKNDYCILSKSKFVELNLYHCLNYYKSGIVTEYWSDIYMNLILFIEEKYNNNNNIKSKLKYSFSFINMSQDEYSNFKNSFASNKNNINSKLEQAFEEGDFDMITKLLDKLK